MEIQDPVVLLDDVLLGDAGGLGRDDVGPLPAPADHPHEFDPGTHRSFAGGRGALQKVRIHAVHGVDKVDVFLGQGKNQVDYHWSHRDWNSRCSTWR